MKEWIKKISENKLQFFFFVGVLAFLFVSLIIVGVTGGNEIEDPDQGNTPVIPNEPDKQEPTTSEIVEKVALPFTEDMEYNVVRKFYDRNGTKEEQEQSLIRYGSSYRTSVGTSFASKDNYHTKDFL